MVASDIVPFDPVVVEIVQYRQARFVITLWENVVREQTIKMKTRKTHLSGFTVVGLSLTKTASRAPVTRIPLRGGSNFRPRTGPEPTVYVGRLQIRAIASVEITFTTRRPNVFHIA